MTQHSIYRCSICGNIVQILFNGNGNLTCCGQEMEKLEAQKYEEGVMEKHVPIFIENEDNTYDVRVGEVLHPMNDEHYIMFIETISNDDNHIEIKFLSSKDEPKMHINNIGNKKALEYCNIHGLWEGNNA